MNIKGKTILAGILMTMGISHVAVSAADMITEWRVFPSANWRNSQNPKKVIQYCMNDRYVFAIMHGNHYSKAVRGMVGYDCGYYAIANPHLFVYDKQNPGKGFCAARDLYPGSKGLNVISIGYNDKKHYLVATYQDGQIELLYDDGRVTHIADFKDAIVPGSKEFNSISFSNEHGEIYLGTQNGYVVIDEDSGSVKEWVKLWSPVHYVNRIGDTLLAIADIETVVSNNADAQPVIETTIVTYDLSQGSPRLLSDLKPIILSDPSGLLSSMYNSQTGHINASDGICPLTDKTFVTLGRKGSKASSTSLISLTRLEDGSYRPLTLADQEVTGLNENFTYKSPNSAAFNRMKDGWSFKMYDFQMVKEGTDPDFTAANPAEDYKSKVLSRVRPAGLGGITGGGSYDGQDFWSFISCGANDVNGGFRRYERTGDTTAELKEQILPQAPMGLGGRNITYSPGYGFIVPGREYSEYFMYSYDVMDQLTVFNGETWIPYSLPVLQPSLSGMWNGARGALIDPEEPKYFYSTSYGSGLLRRNLEDPSDILHVTFGGNYNSSRTTDVEIYPGYVTKTGHNNAYMSRPSIDADGRMWIAGFDARNSSKKPLFYWEKDDRLASVNKDTYKPMKRVEVDMNGENKTELLALTAQNNRTKLVYFGGIYGGELYLWDHKGTIEDTSDDVLVSVSKGFDDEGHELTWSYIDFFEEDPVDGRVWVFAWEGLYWFDPEEFVRTPGLMHKLTVDRVNGQDESSVIAESIQPFGFVVDSHDRKWFGFNGGGIFCISPDNKEQLAYFDTSNSELASNVVFGLGWNPEKNALMISTDQALQEMTILEGGAGSKKSHNIYPTSIDPGYRGHVTIYAADDSHTYAVCDQAGEAVNELGSPTGGKIQWDLHNTEGIRVAAGIYDIMDMTEGLKLGEVLVVE